MSVFRLQDEQAANMQDGRGWFQSAPYNPKSIAAITDPDGGKGSDPTSIPTPFARIDLVRTAFKFVNDKGTDGNTSFHKIVSHALDIGEMFFDYELFEDRISLLEWDKKQQIESLLKSKSPEQQNYGKTLQMYIKQDAKSFNFNAMQKVYILLYNNIPIGGTSPVSLFFSTPNDLSHVDIKFPDGKRAFVETQPLYKRDESFIRFLFCMKASTGEFAGYFPEVNDYLEKNLKKIRQHNPVLFDEINKLDGNQYSQYKSISTGVYITDDLPLRQSCGEAKIVKSDYAIKSDIYNGEVTPLVLKRGHSGKTGAGSQMTYYNGPFDQQTDVPYEESAPLNERYLPGRTGVKYPYLTIGDFLEPYVIRTVFPVNKERFYDGNYNRSDGISYLLPLKKTFFEFFQPNDLNRVVGEGRKMFEMQHRAGNSLKVILRVPVKKGYIEYERIYKGPVNDLDDPKPNIKDNEGAISEHRFDLAVLPFAKFDKKVAAPEYRIALIDGDLRPPNSNHNISLSFYNIDKDVNKTGIIHSRQRVEKKERRLSGVKHYVLKDNFDIISVSISGTDKKGMLIPKFDHAGAGNDQFTFAVDLGTTYTHIEYSINGGSPQPFKITGDDMQVVKLHDPKFEMMASVFPEEKEIFDHDFMPELIGDNMEYFFPVRTSIMELKNMNEEDVCFSMVERNIPFIYEKKPENQLHCRVCSDVKWGVSQTESDRVNAFISNVLLMIRNKVLLNNGSLGETQIIWFYPLSMMEGRKNLLESKWNKLYKLYFAPGKRMPLSVSESLAPFYYYHNTKGTIAHGKPVVSIDIGGETTDVVVFENNQASMLTSFRFAADAIFGDGYRINASEINGFIKHYGKKVYDAFINNNIDRTLISAYEQIKEKQVSKDTIAFFFSLEKNKELKDKNLELSFNQWLSENEDFKVVFVTFYLAIIYHIAKIFKVKQLPLPRYITYSGTGSKVLNIISENDRLLEKITRLTFEKISERSFDNDGINIERDVAISKEITCKGGFFAENYKKPDISKLKTILLGTHDDLLADKTITYKKLNDDGILKSVEKEVLNFIDFVFELFKNEEIDPNHLLIRTSKLEYYKETLSSDIYSFICEGLELQKKELESLDDSVEESLFFYGLKGSLNKLINTISNPENNNEE